MQQRFLLQILLLAEHVSGTTMPIIGSSVVLYSGCCLWCFVPWFSSCWSGVELRVMCPVCRLLQHPANRTHNKRTFAKGCPNWRNAWCSLPRRMAIIVFIRPNPSAVLSSPLMFPHRNALPVPCGQSVLFPLLITSGILICTAVTAEWRYGKCGFVVQYERRVVEFLSVFAGRFTWRLLWCLAS